MDYAYQIKYKGEHPTREPIEEDLLRERLSVYYCDVDLVMECLHEGQHVITPFSLYRAVKYGQVEARSGIDALARAAVAAEFPAKPNESAEDLSEWVRTGEHPECS